MKHPIVKFIVSAFMALAMSSNMCAQSVNMLGKQHCMVHAEQGKRYLLLPIEEKAELCNIRLLAASELVKTLNVRLAVDNIDYYVPLDLNLCGGKPALLDIHVNADSRQSGVIGDYVCWKSLRMSDTFSTENREPWRPLYHHSPAWGWMNDPNGLFFKDGLWHLYFQWNPYGSQWENMHWGHAVSRDLVTWESLGCGMAPDALGTVFSGCSVVDEKNTAGFGAGAVVAMYTSAAESQTQSLAYSLDGGRTFTKYERNPVLVADVPDFRDPHIFWNEKIGQWNLILAAGQEMRIYTSSNLKDWKYESSFGSTYGSHGGVWECPDLFPLTVEGGSEQKWVLLCNINPGGPAGGSATQYFTGSFDGRMFMPDSDPQVTRWMDYGKDHYATVSFANAPDGRRVVIGWMSNWQYAAQVPTRQYRSANTLAREPFAFKEDGMVYVGSRPVEEMQSACGATLLKTSFKTGSKTTKKVFDARQGAYEIVAKIAPKQGEKFSFVLSNGKDEQVTMTYSEAEKSFTMNRDRSGQTSFSEFFPVETKSPVLGGDLTELRLFVDKSSIEAFLNGGKTVMTNIVFPSEPYDRLTVQGSNGSRVSLVIYELKN